ncbi:hypothetical protein T05_12542, partial [Trichinella murrelli]
LNDQQNKTVKICPEIDHHYYKSTLNKNNAT